MLKLSGFMAINILMDSNVFLCMTPGKIQLQLNIKGGG
jgi:hypothetical protein